MTSDFRYEIKTSLPVIWLENIDTKNPVWSVRNELNKDQLILVDLVDEEEEIVHELILQTTDNARSKETERIINTHPIDRSSLSSYFTLASAI
jgi:hypothetical protein